MIEAETNRANALYADLPPDFFNNEEFSTLIRKNSKEKVKKREKKEKTLLQVPGTMNRRRSVMMTSINGFEFDEGKATLQQKAFDESFKILMKEYELRKAARVRQKAAKIKAKNRILAVWAFHKKQDEKKKLDTIKKEQVEKSIGIYSTNKQKTAEDDNEGNNDNQDGALENSNTCNDDNSGETKEDNGILKDDKDGINEPVKRTVHVENLQTRIESKKKQQRLDNKYYIKSNKEVLSEKGKWDAAKQDLVRIKTLQQIRNPELVEVEEEEKRRIVPKFKDIALRVMRINSVKNALKIVKKSQSTSSEQEQEQKEKGKECETGGMP